MKERESGMVKLILKLSRDKIFGPLDYFASRLLSFRYSGLLRFTAV